VDACWSSLFERIWGSFVKETLWTHIGVVNERIWGLFDKEKLWTHVGRAGDYPIGTLGTVPRAPKPKGPPKSKKGKK